MGSKMLVTGFNPKQKVNYVNGFSKCINYVNGSRCRTVWDKVGTYEKLFAETSVGI